MIRPTAAALSSRAAGLLLAIPLIVSCAAAAPTTGPTATPATPTATASVTATPPPATATPAAATATPTAAASTPPAGTGCDPLLTVADLGPGFGQVRLVDYTPNPEAVGFVAGTQIGFESVDGVISWSSTRACFDTADNAQLLYDRFGVVGGCIGADMALFDATPIPAIPVIGDAAKGTFCPASEAGSRTVAGTASIYVQKGTSVFSVTFNMEGMQAITPDVLAEMISAAGAVAGRIGG